RRGAVRRAPARLPHRRATRILPVSRRAEQRRAGQGLAAHAARPVAHRPQRPRRRVQPPADARGRRRGPPPRRHRVATRPRYIQEDHMIRTTYELEDLVAALRAVADGDATPEAWAAAGAAALRRLLANPDCLAPFGALPAADHNWLLHAEPENGFT